MTCDAACLDSVLLLHQLQHEHPMAITGQGISQQNALHIGNIIVYVEDDLPMRVPSCKVITAVRQETPLGHVHF